MHIATYRGNISSVDCYTYEWLSIKCTDHEIIVGTQHCLRPSLTRH